MLRPSPNHETQRLPNDDDDEYFPMVHLIGATLPLICSLRVHSALVVAQQIHYKHTRVIQSNLDGIIDRLDKSRYIKMSQSSVVSEKVGNVRNRLGAGKNGMPSSRQEDACSA